MPSSRSTSATSASSSATRANVMSWCGGLSSVAITTRPSRRVCTCVCSIAPVSPGWARALRSSPRGPPRRSTVPAMIARRAHSPFETHEVTNQPPPLRGRNLFLDNVPLVGGDRARGRRLDQRARERGRRVLGRRADGLGRAREQAHAGAAHARPLRQPHRRGRVRPVVAPADGGRHARRAARAAVAHRPRRRARRSRRALHDGDAGRGGLRLPDHDDVRGDPGAARCSPSSPPSGSRC